MFGNKYRCLLKNSFYDNRLPKGMVFHREHEPPMQTHFRSLLRVQDENARLWYLKESSEQNWSSRTLDRNIATQYYYRLFQSPSKEKVIAEMQSKTVDFQKNPFELIKNPVVAEFLGFKAEDAFTETQLESA